MLPLITARIEFQLRELPPPSQITPHCDLGAQLRRRQARQNSVTYSRPRHTSEETPAITVSDLIFGQCLLCLV